MSKLWIILVTLSAAFALWFSGKAAKDLWNYLKLDASAPATVAHWSVKELSANAFAPSGNYFFEAGGQRWEGSTTLSGHIYPNPYAAQRAIEPLQAHAWSSWYSQKDPSVSSLQKFFPFKSVIQALVTLGITLYFFCMQTFLKRFA